MGMARELIKTIKNQHINSYSPSCQASKVDRAPGVMCSPPRTLPCFNRSLKNRLEVEVRKIVRFMLSMLLLIKEYGRRRGEKTDKDC